METLVKNSVGLFPVEYNIGGNMPGAPLFNAAFLVNTPAKTVVGSGVISQAVNPPLEVNTQLTGTYTYMTVMPKNTHILVVAEGVDKAKQPNVELRMVLEEDWKSGVANYKFYNGTAWVEIENAPVAIVVKN